MAQEVVRNASAVCAACPALPRGRRHRLHRPVLLLGVGGAHARAHRGHHAAAARHQVRAARQPVLITPPVDGAVEGATSSRAGNAPCARSCSGSRWSAAPEIAARPRVGRERRAVQAVVRRRARPTLRPQDSPGEWIAQLRPAPHHQLRLRLPLPAAAAARLRGWARAAPTRRRRRRRRRPRRETCSPRRGSSFSSRSALPLLRRATASTTTRTTRRPRVTASSERARAHRLLVLLLPSVLDGEAGSLGPGGARRAR